MKYLLLEFCHVPALAADMTIEMLNKDADGNKMVYSEEMRVSMLVIPSPGPRRPRVIMSR